MLTEERFPAVRRPALELIAEAFAQLQVTVGVVTPDDVLSDARERTEAHQELDDVLTDRTGSEPVEALNGNLSAVTV